MDFNNKLFLKFLMETDSGGQIPFGQRLSPKQRKLALVRWREFVAIRQILGTCLHCNRKHQPNMKRCGVHRNINKARCLAWAKENRSSIRAQYQERKSKGICVNSPKHGRVFNKHILCLKCFNNKKNSRQTSRKESKSK